MCDIVVADGRHRYTTPRLAAFARDRYPDLPYHACVNDAGSLFGDVIERTSTPHLLEHIAISEQARAAEAPEDRFLGTTEWTGEDVGEARVTISFRDDLEALRAFNNATRFVNIAVLTCLS